MILRIVIVLMVLSFGSSAESADAIIDTGQPQSETEIALQEPTQTERFMKYRLSVRKVCDYYLEKNSDQALRFCLWVREHFPEQYKSSDMVNAGVAYTQAGDPKKAEELYRATIRVDDKNFYAWYNLAMLQVRLGKYQEAANLLALIADDDAIRVRANSAQDVALVYTNLSKIFEIVGNIVDADVNKQRAEIVHKRRQKSKILDPKTGLSY